MENEDDNTNVKVIDNLDKSMKMLGELLSNGTSRDLIKLLVKKSYYKNELAEKLGIQFSLIDHHLNKMLSIGLVKKTHKIITKRGILHEFYEIKLDGVYILFRHSINKLDDGRIQSLKKTFRKEVKFVSVGLAVLTSWFLSKWINQNDVSPPDVNSGITSSFSIDWFSLNYDVWIPIVVVSVSVLLTILLKNRFKRD